jgi:hypothetical protein
LGNPLNFTASLIPVLIKKRRRIRGRNNRIDAVFWP